MEKKTIIGIIGEQAGGKGSASDIIIKRYGGIRITTSSILRRTLDSLHIPFSRENLINLAMILKKGFGDAVLMEAALKDVENIDSDLVIVDGIRMRGDTDPFKKVYKESFTLIYVTADPKVRYERSKKRGEKAGEKTATFEEFLAKEKAPTEASIAEVGATADYKIINNGGYEELEKKVIEVMEKI